MKYSNLALGASNLLLGTAVGAGVNQSIFVMPGWFSSPPQSMPDQQASGAFQKFWIPLQSSCALALGAAFALNRKHDDRRKLLSWALGLYVGTWVATAAYFAPEIIRLRSEENHLRPAEVARRGGRWLRLTWARHLAMGAAWALTALALTGKPSRRVLSLARSL
jgi:hypothetical protein